MSAMSKANIKIDRKNLSDLAVKEPKTFEFIAKKAKEVFGKKA